MSAITAERKREKGRFLNQSARGTAAVMIVAVCPEGNEEMCIRDRFGDNEQAAQHADADVRFSDQVEPVHA